METSAVLNLAADLIEERGWTAGSGWKDDGGPLCLEGGIAAAAGLSFVRSWSCPAYGAVTAYLDGAVPFVWNDGLKYDKAGGGHRWVGGSREAAEAFAKGRVIEVLRACALIEAAREEQDAAWQTYADVVSA